MMQKLRYSFLTLIAFVSLTVLALSSCSLFQDTSKPADQVLKDMQTSYFDLKSGAFEIKPKFAISSPEGKGNFDITLTGKTDKNNKKLSLDVGFSGEADMENQKGKITANFSVIAIEDSFYFKISTVTLPDSIKMMAGPYLAALESVKDQWFNIPANMLPEEAQDSMKLWSVGDKDQTPEEKDIEELAKNTQFFKVEKDYGIETIKGVSTRHLDIVLEKEATIKFMSEVAKLKKEGIPPAGQMEEDLNKFFDTFTHKISVWVGVDDNFLYQLSGELAGTEKESGTEISFSAMANFSNHNKAQEVSAPATTKSFTDLIQTMSNVSAPGMPQEAGLPVTTPDEILDEEINNE